jgi:hypothetical protein
MLGGLEHPVREPLADRLEIFFRLGEMILARNFEQELEFCSMDLETVDLFVAQNKTPNHFRRMEERFSFLAQARISCKGFVCAYPRADRPFGNVHVQPLADHALRITHGAAEIVGRDGFEDHSRRVAFVLSCICGEFVKTLSALK